MSIRDHFQKLPQDHQCTLYVAISYTLAVVVAIAVVAVIVAVAVGQFGATIYICICISINILLTITITITISITISFYLIEILSCFDVFTNISVHINNFGHVFRLFIDKFNSKMLYACLDEIF